MSQKFSSAAVVIDAFRVKILFLGCVCVYSSVESLEYVRSSILKVLEADQEGRYESLPMIVMLAYEPYTQKELNYLRDNGRVLANR